MYKNQLCVDLKAFNHAMKLFKVGMVRVRKNAKNPPVMLPAMLSFNNGFLSIECNDKVAVMNAIGEWHGKAQFSHTIIQALALVPLTANPVIISYENGKLCISATTIACDWQSISQSMLDQVANPTLIDVFAMWRTHPAEQLLVKGIMQKNKLAKVKLMKTTVGAAKKLEEFEVTQDDLLKLIEEKVKARIIN